MLLFSRFELASCAKITMTKTFPSPAWKVSYAGIAVAFAYPMTQYVELRCYLLSVLCLMFLVFLGLPLKVLPVSVVQRMWIAILPALVLVGVSALGWEAALCSLL